MVKYANLSLPEVKKLAQKLAYDAKQKKLIIGLCGNLGSGKTTFAKAFARSLGIKSLKSPTFIVSQRYPLNKRYLFHLDFYRLEHKKDLEVLGISEILLGDNIVLIEWVDKFPQIEQKCNLVINFMVKPKNKRDVTIQTN